MPSVKTKFTVDEKSGLPKRCPKNEAQLRRLPECGIFDYNIKPFTPVKPPPPPYPPKPPEPPDPKHSPFSPFKMEGLPDIYRRDLVPNTPAANDVRFPDAELLPDDPNPESRYYSFAELPQDNMIAYSRGRTLMSDMINDKVFQRAHDPAALRRTMKSVLDKNNQDPFRVRNGLEDVDVLVDEPAGGYYRRLPQDPESGIELRTFRQQNEPIEEEAADPLADIAADRIPSLRPARSGTTSIQRLTNITELPEFQDLALDSTNEFSIQQSRVPKVRPKPTRLQKITRGIASVRTIEFDPTSEQIETIEEGVEEPPINPFGSQQEAEDAILKLAGKKIRRDRPSISKREIDQIYEKLRKEGRGVTREQIRNLLYKNLLFEEDFEINIEMADTTTREKFRREKAIKQKELREAPPDEGGFQPRRRVGLGAAETGRKRRGYGTLSLEDPDIEEGQIMGRTNQNALELDTQEKYYKVRVSGRNAADIITMNTIRARRAVQEASRQFAKASSQVKSFTNDLAVATDRNLANIRTNVAEALRTGYTNVVAATSRLTPEEIDDLKAQLEQLPPEEDLATRGVGIPKRVGPQVDLESGLDVRQLESDLDFNIFDDVTTRVIGASERPSLSFRQRLSVARESFADVPKTEIATSFAGAGAGMLGAFGLSALLSKAGVNPYANAAASGAFGDTTGRISAMVGSQIYSRLTAGGATAAGEAIAESAGQVALRAGTSLLRGAAEGGAIGLATLPLDLLMNKALVNSGMSHAGANTVSAAATGTIATAAIGGVTLASAPETLGLSLLVGGVATGISALVGYFTGKAEDDKIVAARDDQNSKTQARNDLLKTLPDFDYNFDDALSALQKNSPSRYELLQPDTDDFKEFKHNMSLTFQERPEGLPSPSVEPATGDAKKVNDLFTQSVMHTLINKVCANSSGNCKELREKQPPDITDDDKKFLDEQTNQTWLSSVKLMVEQSFQEMQYTGVRIQDSQQYLLDEWNDTKTPAKNLDSYYAETAFLDPSFESKYLKNIKLDAQNEVVKAYYKDQSKLQDLDPNIIYAANLDPDFEGVMNKFYSAMEQGATNLQISVDQLITLQGLAPEKQGRRYERMQFNRIKGQGDVAKDAADLAEQQDAVRRSGYYDIDAGFLDTADPTSISHWKPSDSQILQANSAGMSLNEYVEYIHQLGLGTRGDFSKIPTYTPTAELDLKKTDFKHFQDELQMAGYSPNLYMQDEQGNIVINPNANQIPNLDAANEYVSIYRPAYIEQAQNQYADMITNLNEKNQADVDDYNANVRRQLSVFGDNYDEMVANQNDVIARTALTTTPLLVFNQQDYLNQYLIDYNPLDTQFPKEGDTTQPVTTAGGDTYLPINNDNNGSVIDEKKQMETEAAAKFGLSRDEYLASKTLIEQEFGTDTPTNRQALEVIGRIKRDKVLPVQTTKEPTLPSVVNAPHKKGVDPQNVVKVAQTKLNLSE
jgi:hypothetical protein